MLVPDAGNRTNHTRVRVSLKFPGQDFGATVGGQCRGHNVHSYKIEKRNQNLNITERNKTHFNDTRNHP